MSHQILFVTANFGVMQQLRFAIAKACEIIPITNHCANYVTVYLL